MRTMQPGHTNTWYADARLPRPSTTCLALSKGVGWSLPVDSSVLDELPVFTVHRPGDWADLVERYPKAATPGQGCWGLPNNQSALRSTHPLFSLDNQRASIERHDRHHVPDWTGVANDYEGVHLSWGGWMTSEGYAHLDEDKTVTMVRYWFTDRTFWLHDVFGEPHPLPATDISQKRLVRDEQDEREMLDHILGR